MIALPIALPIQLAKRLANMTAMATRHVPMTAATGSTLIVIFPPCLTLMDRGDGVSSRSVVTDRPTPGPERQPGGGGEVLPPGPSAAARDGPFLQGPPIRFLVVASGLGCSRTAPGSFSGERSQPLPGRATHRNGPGPSPRRRAGGRTSSQCRRCHLLLGGS